MQIIVREKRDRYHRDKLPFETLSLKNVSGKCHTSKQVASHVTQTFFLSKNFQPDITNKGDDKGVEDIKVSV